MSIAKSDYQVFREARDVITQKGWLQKGFTDGTRSCLIQAVSVSSQNGSDTYYHYARLTARQAEILHKHMRHFPVYMMAFSAGMAMGESFGQCVQKGIIAWNDIGWRMKGGVVKLLDSVLDSLAHEEIARLNGVIETLRSELDRRQRRIDALADENATLRQRIASFFLHPADKSELQKLSDELDATWDELKKVSA